MAKFHPSKLSKEEREGLFIELCYVLSRTSNIKEAAELLRDLLTAQEIEMISKRLSVADLLLEGLTYSEIQRILKVSNTTIARVHEWIKVACSGLRLAKEKLKKYKERTRKTIKSRMNLSSWEKMKRRYPMYFWPQLVLEEIIKSANEKQREKIRNIIKQTNQKTQLYKQLNKILTKNI